MDTKSKLTIIAATYMAIVNVANANSSLVQYGGHYYKRYDTSMSWHQAKAFCQKKGGYLVVVTSSGENTFVTNLASSSPHQGVWLGATDAATEGVWKWVTGEAWSYTNWNSGEPNNYPRVTTPEGINFDEDYLQIISATDYRWNDTSSINAMANSGPISTICEWVF